MIGKTYWSQKVQLLALAYAPDKFESLSGVLFDGFPAAEVTRIQKSLWHYKNNNGTPKLHTIPNRLVEAHGFTGPARDLIHCDLADFIDKMPDEVRSAVLKDSRHRQLLEPELISAIGRRKGREGPRLHTHGFGRGYHVVHVTPAYETVDTTEALERGKFDQSYLYLDRSAAMRWNTLTSSPGRYSTFRNCLESLEDVVNQKPWTDLVSEIETVIVLGGGAAKKDNQIVQSLLSHRGGAKHPVQYIVVDTSVHMLLSTLQELERLVDHKRAAFIELTGFVADFTRLEDTIKILEREHSDIHRHGKRTVFFLPGNTLANFDPEEMFENIYGNSKEGDIFLLSSEVVVQGKEDSYALQMEGRYRTRDLVNLVLPPIRPFLDAKGIDVIGERALEKIKSTRVKGFWGDLHYIKDVFTIEIRVLDPAADVDVVLATSSRYTYDSLVKLGDSIGFDLIGKPVKVDLEFHEHHQLMFQRRPVRRSPSAPTS